MYKMVKLPVPWNWMLSIVVQSLWNACEESGHSRPEVSTSLMARDDVAWALQPHTMLSNAALSMSSVFMYECAFCLCVLPQCPLGLNGLAE